MMGVFAFIFRRELTITKAYKICNARGLRRGGLMPAVGDVHIGNTPGRKQMEAVNVPMLPSRCIAKFSRLGQLSRERQNKP